jgi:hypothetical protein
VVRDLLDDGGAARVLAGTAAAVYGLHPSDDVGRADHR